jgi:hypothetical protein
MNSETHTDYKHAIYHKPTQKWVRFANTDFDFFITTIELVNFKDCLFVSNKEYLELFLKRSVLDKTPNYGSENFLEFEFVKIKVTYIIEEVDKT